MVPHVRRVPRVHQVFYIRRRTRPRTSTRQSVCTLSLSREEIFMPKTKMENIQHLILVLATVIWVIMFAGPCEAQGDPGKPETGAGQTPGVLPVSTAKPGESGLVDANNHPVTQGLTGLISPAIWPATYSFLRVLNFVLRVFFGQKLPCTVWSVAPPRMKCTMLD